MASGIEISDLRELLGTEDDGPNIAGRGSQGDGLACPRCDSRVVREDEEHDAAAEGCAQARDVAGPGEDLVRINGELDLAEDAEQIGTAVLDAEDAICAELDGAGATEVVAVRGDRGIDREVRTGRGAEEINDDARLVAKQVGPPVVECRRHAAKLSRERWMGRSGAEETSMGADKR